MKKLMKQMAVSSAALALVLVLAGTAAAGVTVFAEVTGYGTATNENNNPDFWETGDIEECEKVDGVNAPTFLLTADYELVIVKSSDHLTFFADAEAGETVFADTNENGVFDPGGQDGDKDISHVILCDEVETTTTTSFTSSEESTTDSESTTTTESTTDFTDSISDTTTQPPTDTIGETGAGQQSGSMWLLLAVLGVLAGSVIVLAPSKAKNQD